MSRSSELGTLASCSTVILDLDADATASGPGINGVAHLEEISASTAKSSEGEESEKKKKRRKRVRGGVYKVVEVLCLSVAILVVLVVYVIVPTSQFVSPPLDFKPLAISDCSLRVPYEGQVCLLELSFYGMVTPNISVASQEVLEEQSSIILNHAFPSFNPSLECYIAFRVLFCLSVFGACDGNSSQLATRGLCTNVRDEVCAGEWALASDFLGPQKLPVCEDLPDTEGLGLTQIFSDFGVAGNDSRNDSVDMSSGLNCSFLFYFNPATRTCRPTCLWSPHPFSNSMIALAYFSLVLQLLFCCINILLAFTIQRQTILIIPTGFFVMLNIDVLVIGILGTLEATLPQYRCSSLDFISGILLSSTRFCTAVGSCTRYFLFQSSYAVFFFTLFLFWGIVFPFSYKVARKNERVKYAFIVAVVICLLLPLISLALLSDGYLVGNFWLNRCTPRDSVGFYLVSILLSGVLLSVSSTFLILIMWKIFKHLILRRLRQMKDRFGPAERAELKLLSVLVYFIVIAVIALAVDSFTVEVTPRRYLNALLPYFACESSGKDNGRDCQILLLEVQQNSIFNLYVVLLVLTGIFPVVIFMFSADFRLFVKYAKTVSKKCTSCT